MLLQGAFNFVFHTNKFCVKKTIIGHEWKHWLLRLPVERTQGLINFTFFQLTLQSFHWSIFTFTARNMHISFPTFIIRTNTLMWFSYGIKRDTTGIYRLTMWIYVHYLSTILMKLSTKVCKTHSCTPLLPPHSAMWHYRATSHNYLIKTVSLEFRPLCVMEAFNFNGAFNPRLLVLLSFLWCCSGVFC